MKKKTVENQKIRYRYLFKNGRSPEGIQKITSTGEKYTTTLNNKFQEKEEIFLFDAGNSFHVNAKIDAVLNALQQLSPNY